MVLFFMIFKSNHPHLLFLPVVTPTSAPVFYKNSPNSFFYSDGNGPVPTLVVYAFMTPIIVSILCGGTPVPVHIPPLVVLEEVTNG